MVKQPGHLTSMKKERGAGTRVCCFLGLGFFWLFEREGERGRGRGEGGKRP